MLGLGKRTLSTTSPELQDDFLTLSMQAKLQQLREWGEPMLTTLGVPSKWWAYATVYTPHERVTVKVSSIYYDTPDEAVNDLYERVHAIMVRR